MEEDNIISYDTRKLAIEKGWDVEKVMRCLLTQSKLQKYLREKHGVAVIVNLDDTLSWWYKIVSLHPNASYTGNTILSDNVWCGDGQYEEALESALFNALTLI